METKTAIPQEIKNKIVGEANWRSTNGHGGVDDITRDNFIIAAEYGYSLAIRPAPLPDDLKKWIEDEAEAFYLSSNGYDNQESFVIGATAMYNLLSSKLVEWSKEIQRLTEVNIQLNKDVFNAEANCESLESQLQEQKKRLQAAEAVLENFTLMNAGLDENDRNKNVDMYRHWQELKATR